MAQLWHLKAKSHKIPCIITAGNDNSVGFLPPFILHRCICSVVDIKIDIAVFGILADYATIEQNAKRLPLFSASYLCKPEITSRNTLKY